MSNKLIVANHKMNMDIGQINTYIKDLKNVNKKDVVICPTSIYIPYFLEHNFEVGIQNIFNLSSGAYTGEVSPMQVKSIGVNYVILGHSERRNILNEDNCLVNQKVIEALKNDLKVILCIGESLEQKNKTKEILKKQIIEGLKNIDKIENIIVAYEPIWSIGTGLIPQKEEISSTIFYIRTIIDNLFPGSNVKILYGGSVNEENIEELNSIKEVDGFLIGGASLNSKSFLKIIEVVGNQ